MRYKTRSVRRSASKARRKLFSTILIILLLLFATMQWLLPNVIGGVDLVKGILNPVKQTDNPTSLNATLAPPVLFLPYEATSSAAIDIRGYATANSQVKIFLDDELKDTVSVGADGNLVARDIILSLGKNNIYGKTVDEKNTESLPSKTLIITYDNEKPNLVVNEPEDGKIVKEKKITVSGSTEADIPVLVNNSRVITNSEGSFTTTIQLSDGDNTITIKAVDLAENSTEITRKVTVQP